MLWEGEGKIGWLVSASVCERERARLLTIHGQCNTVCITLPGGVSAAQNYCESLTEAYKVLG